MKPTIVPFVKWVGGKRQLLKLIVKRIPKTYNNYHEPFLGGGAVFFKIQPANAYISDLNKQLINSYKVIKRSYKKLSEYLLIMEYGHGEKFYNKIRSVDRNQKTTGRVLTLNHSKEFNAARFIYLNKAGFNGMYRVNKAGFFNVPHGKKIEVKTYDYNNLEKISKYLKSNEIKIRYCSFEETINDIKENDFVYIDPPYDYEPPSKGFDSYQKNGFNENDQIKLSKYCKEIDKKGGYFMLSNHNTKLINKLYKDFNIEVIKARRAIGGKGASRKSVEEVLVTNYEN